MKKSAPGIVCVIICIFMLSNPLAFAADFRFSPHPNKANLIHWRHWGKAAFEESRKTGKPILLSLSAIWCHWCHEMDEKTYSDTSVIDFINGNFIPVRVDADRSPDVDSLYNQGGWPSTVVLNQDGEVVRGETFIPPEGMIAWLGGALKQKAGEPLKKEEDAKQAAPGKPGRPSTAGVVDLIESSFDSKYGGFGASEKFPNPDAIDFLLTEYPKDKSAGLGKIINVTLTNMAKGGIYDAVEGGFFRYATKPDWSAPHYEKLLDLNAGLMENYAAAYMVFGKGEYRKTLEGTAGYIKKNLLDRKTGAFYGSQDADEEYYKASERAPMKPPHVDRTVYAGFNAQAISAFVAAYGATGKREYLRMAEKAAGFIMKKMYSTRKGVYHYYADGEKHLDGLLADNALVGTALLDLHNATGKVEYLKTAEDIAHLLVAAFYDKKDARFRPSIAETAARPSAAGILMDYNTAVASYRALVFLARVYRTDGDETMRKTVDASVAGFVSTWDRFKPAAGLLGTALEWTQGNPVDVTIVTEGRPDDFLYQSSRVYVPLKVVKVLSTRKDKARLDDLGYPPETAVYLCSGHKCSPPIKKAEDMPAGIRRFLEPGK